MLIKCNQTRNSRLVWGYHASHTVWGVVGVVEPMGLEVCGWGERSGRVGNCQKLLWLCQEAPSL